MNFKMAKYPVAANPYNKEVCLEKKVVKKVNEK